MTKPFLHGVVDTLYHIVMDPMPQFIQDRDMTSAVLLGGGGAYGVVRGLQYLSKNVADRIIPGFDEHALPILEKICIAGMILDPLAYSIIDPDGAREIVSQHPTYSAGMTSAGVCSITGAVQDLHKRQKQNLEAPIKESLE